MLAHLDGSRDGMAGPQGRTLPYRLHSSGEAQGSLQTLGVNCWLGSDARTPGQLLAGGSCFVRRCIAFGGFCTPAVRACAVICRRGVACAGMLQGMPRSRSGNSSAHRFTGIFIPGMCQRAYPCRESFFFAPGEKSFWSERRWPCDVLVQPHGLADFFGGLFNFL